MDWVHVLALWLHTLAFVIAWGYYGVLARTVIPTLERSLDRPAQATVLAGVERRALPLIGLAIVLFLVTGVYLLFSDPQYAGLGNVRASAWTTLMLIKHLLVVVMIGLGVGMDVLVRWLAEDPGEDDRPLRRVRRTAEAATAVGALIALVTAAAQVA
jgi:uncharacterized membrane protein